MPSQVSEKAAAGAARAGEKAKEAKTAAAHKLEEAQHGLDEMHLTDRVSDLKHAAAERMHEAGDRISTATGLGAAHGPSLGVVVVAAPAGSERDALLRQFRDLPGGHYETVPCASVDEAKEEIEKRSLDARGRIRALLVREGLAVKAKGAVTAVAGGGGGVVLNFDVGGGAQEEALPPGWEVRQSTQYFAEDGSGRTFYFHTETKETSWERPKAGAPDSGGAEPAAEDAEDGAVGLLDWFRQQAGAEGVPCVLVQSVSDSQALKSAAGLKVAQAKGFATFDQFQAHLVGLSEEEKTALVGELNAVFKADVEAARAEQAARAEAAKAAGGVTIWDGGRWREGQEAVQALARHLGTLERARQQEARRAFGPTVPLKVWCCTFNIVRLDTSPHPTAAKTNECCGQACAKDAVVPGQAKAVFAPWVPDDYDLYVLGMQEGIGDNFIHGLEEYLKEFDVEMLPDQGKGGPRIEGRGDGSLLVTKYTGIVAFAKASLILDGHVKIERAAVHHFEGADMTKAKDVKESLGSKGGAALALRCFDTTFAVISVHMAKEWHKVAKKRAQYRELADQLGRKLGSDEFQLHSQFHHIVWMGDFNYHISTEVEAEDCCMAIAGVTAGGVGQRIPTGKSSWETLGPHDEMRKEMEGGHVYYSATAVPA